MSELVLCNNYNNIFWIFTCIAFLLSSKLTEKNKKFVFSHFGFSVCYLASTMRQSKTERNMMNKGTIFYNLSSNGRKWSFNPSRLEQTKVCEIQQSSAFLPRFVLTQKSSLKNNYCKSPSCNNWWGHIRINPFSFTLKVSLHHLSLQSLKSFHIFSPLLKKFLSFWTPSPFPHAPCLFFSESVSIMASYICVFLSVQNGRLVLVIELFLINTCAQSDTSY